MKPRGRASRSTGVLVLLVVVGGTLGALAATAAVAGASGTGIAEEPLALGSHQPSVTAQATVEEFDDVEVVILVASDGAATWRVRYRYRLGEDGGSAAFERARENVSNPPGVFVERMREAARRGERRTGRDMRIRNGSVSAYTTVPHGRFGVVEYRFTWTAFAAREGDRIVAGDVIGGYPIGANESLVLGWRESLQATEVSPSPNESHESTVRWEGPHEFAVTQPEVVLERTGAGGLTTLVTRPPGVVLLGGAFAALVAVTVAVKTGYGHLVVRALPGGGERGNGPAAASSDDDVATDADGAEGSDVGSPDATPPEDLLSDEERVLQLLEANGGRMKQQDLKETLEWSRTKTSNVVNDLQDADRIEVYRLGRENTLALPGEMDV